MHWALWDWAAGRPGPMVKVNIESLASLVLQLFQGLVGVSSRQHHHCCGWNLDLVTDHSDLLGQLFASLRILLGILLGGLGVVGLDAVGVAVHAHAGAYAGAGALQLSNRFGLGLGTWGWGGFLSSLMRFI
jgi:hypothetical protein